MIHTGISKLINAMKRIILFIFVLSPLLGNAQTKTFEQYKAEQQAKYQKYKSAKQKEYDAYRQQINADYAAYMKQSWTAYKSYAAKKKPKDQDAPKPAVKMDNTPPPTNEIRYKLVISIVPYEAPEPVVPIDEPPADDKPTYSFQFHGTP